MRKEILICDHCGTEGHDPKEPGIQCIKALKEKIQALEKEIADLNNRRHITIPLTPKDQDWINVPGTGPNWPFPGSRPTIID